MRQWATSAPAKVILFGEHAVNRAQPALATAVDLRTTCMVTRRDDDVYVLRAGDQAGTRRRADLVTLGESVAAARAAQDVAAIQRLAGADFFAPACYVLSLLLREHALPGLEITWRSTIPVGAGLGSGAAAVSALVLALTRVTGQPLPPRARAHLAWQADVIAHGGIASGLDSAAATFGGLVRYTLAHGPEPLPARTPLPVVVGDTGVRANTAEVNGRVRAWLEAHPDGAALFPLIGDLTGQALQAVAHGDLPELGRLMNENQAILAQIGVSSPEIERLVAAARAAGALGAKLSGSGGGGIILALCAPGGQEAVATAIASAGGQALVAAAAVAGARDEGLPASSN